MMIKRTSWVLTRFPYQQSSLPDMSTIVTHYQVHSTLLQIRLNVQTFTVSFASRTTELNNWLSSLGIEHPHCISCSPHHHLLTQSGVEDVQTRGHIGFHPTTRWNHKSFLDAETQPACVLWTSQRHSQLLLRCHHFVPQAWHWRRACELAAAAKINSPQLCSIWGCINCPMARKGCCWNWSSRHMGMRKSRSCSLFIEHRQLLS